MARLLSTVVVTIRTGIVSKIINIISIEIVSILTRLIQLKGTINYE